MTKWIIFTVCNGKNRSLDNQATEMVHRVLNRRGVDKRSVYLNSKRCFIIPYSIENKQYVDKLTNRYGTSAFRPMSL